MPNPIRILLSVAVLACATAVSADEDAEQRVLNAMQRMIPGIAPSELQAGPMDGFYEVSYGTQIFYVSADGRYLLNGEVLDMDRGVNVTEERKGGARLDALSALPPESLITYPATGERKHTIRVFTDIDCGYCRKLHDGMAEMNALGIEVQYLAYPRAGLGSESYRKAVSVWCADDRKEEMDRAKSGKTPKARECENPVADHMGLGEMVGVRGTPAILLEDGQLLPGYLPPNRMLENLEKAANGR